jgi:hypothetical protein
MSAGRFLRMVSDELPKSRSHGHIGLPGLRDLDRVRSGPTPEVTKSRRVLGRRDFGTSNPPDIWRGRIPAIGVTALTGTTREGVALIAIDLAVRVAMGRPMPDETPAQASITRPDGAGGTATLAVAYWRVDADALALKGVAVMARAAADGATPPLAYWRDAPLDDDALTARIKAGGVRYVVIDALRALLAGHSDTAADVIARLDTVATRTRCAVFLIDDRDALAEVTVGGARP